MKHIKTYDGLESSYSTTSIDMRKILDDKVYELIDKIYKLLKKYNPEIIKTQDAISFETGHEILNIISYNNVNIRVEINIVSEAYPYLSSLPKNIINFILSVFKKDYYDLREFEYYSIFYLTIPHVNKIIEELTPENYELYSATSTYNL